MLIFCPGIDSFELFRDNLLFGKGCFIILISEYIL